MKVQIRDEEALKSLTSAHLRAYLEAQGWGNPRPWGPWGISLSKEQRGKLWEIPIPLQDDGFGYAKFMSHVVATLAEAEERSQLDVFYDLTRGRDDMVEQADRQAGGELPNVWCVHAGKGKYTQHFLDGGFFGYGWGWPDLTACEDQNEVSQKLASEVFAPGTAMAVIGAFAGMATCVMWKIQAGDWVITPEKDTNSLRYGKVAPGSCCYVPNAPDGCPDTLRRRIVWAEQPLLRDTLSTPMQNTLKFAAKSVFKVDHREEFLTVIGPHRNMLDKLLQMDETEFEMLVGTALKHKGWKIAK